MPTSFGGISLGIGNSLCGYSSTTTNEIIWPEWNWAYQTQMGNHIWQSWVGPISTNAGAGTLTIPTGVTGGLAGTIYPTPEQVAAQRERNERENAVRAAAKIRARALFEDALSPDQRRELADHRCITVESQNSKRRYRIRCDSERHGNIIELDPAGVEVAKLCVAPAGYLPLEDALLGQMLFLQHDEEALRRAANITPLRRSA